MPYQIYFFLPLFKAAPFCPEISSINNDQATRNLLSPIEFLAGGQNAAFLIENFNVRIAQKTVESLTFFFFFFRTKNVNFRQSLHSFI